MDTLNRHLDENSRVEHPEGWDALVTGLNSALEKISDTYILHQTKAKFGQLRFYATYVAPEGATPEESKEAMDRFHRLIYIAEDQSLTLCEMCGATATRADAGGGYYRTLCEEHWRNRG